MSVQNSKNVSFLQAEDTIGVQPQTSTNAAHQVLAVYASMGQSPGSKTQHNERYGWRDSYKTKMNYVNKQPLQLKRPQDMLSRSTSPLAYDKVVYKNTL